LPPPRPSPPPATEEQQVSFTTVFHELSIDQFTNVEWTLGFVTKYRQVTAQKANVDVDAVTVHEDQIQAGSVRVPTTVGIADSLARSTFKNNVELNPSTLYAEMEPLGFGTSSA